MHFFCPTIIPQLLLSQMDNFEYSIQLNDQDWAEFYLASEECSLIQAALATADEQFPSDLDEGEADESRLTQVTVGPNLASGSASCIPRGSPDRHLLAADGLSGSKDETDLGSVSRFRHNNSPCGTGFPQPSKTREGQLSSVPLKPLGSQCELPGPVTECEAVYGVTEGESETGDGPVKPYSSLPVGLQKGDVQRQKQGPETPACTVHTNLDASKGMNNPTGGNRSDPVCLKLQAPTDDISRAASVDVQFPMSKDSNAMCGISESRDLAADPSSVCFSSPEAEWSDKSIKNGQPVLKAEITPLQEELSLSQGHVIPVVRVLAPTEHLPDSPREEALGSRSSGEEEVSDLKDEEVAPSRTEDLTSDILREESQGDLETSHLYDKVVNLQQYPKGLGANQYRRPTLSTDSRCDGTVDKQRETSAWNGRAEKTDSGESFCHLGMAVPFGEGPCDMAQGLQRTDMLGENAACCLALEDSQGTDLTSMTWPELYDYFFCNDTPEQARKMWEVVSNTQQELPEMYGPEMYEYFFSETDGALVKESSRDRGANLEGFGSSNQPSAPPGGWENPDFNLADGSRHISVPEVYEHFFAYGAKDKKNWKGVFLSMPASEARKAMRALKSFVCKPVRLLRSHPPSHKALLQRGSQGRLVLLSPRLLTESQPRPEDLGMAVMLPGTTFLVM